ncbi:MAG: NAD(P)-dependent oxidoreductase [Burkholderiales bacterium]|nr:NAD(P)-dependent oxidoreductase [Burkholderiales bacterium]
MSAAKASPGRDHSRVGFVGLGIIGSAFSKHLLAAGFEVGGFDPESARMRLFRSRGGRTRSSAAAVAAECDVVVTALASFAAYEAAYFGSRGIVARARRGLIVADVSTMPLERKLAARDRLARVGATLLDCPISGTGAQAETRDVAVYASGPAARVEAVRPVLEGFARKVWYAGEFGAGSKLKFIANHLVTIHNVAAAEAITLGLKSGLEPKLMLAALSNGAGSSRMLEVRGPLMLADRYDEPTMKCDVYQKDIDIIGEFAARLRCPTPLFDASRALYSAALGQGRDKQDTAAVCAVLKEMAGVATAVARPSSFARGNTRKRGMG